MSLRIVVVASLSRTLINFRGALLKDMVNAGHNVIAIAPYEDDQPNTNDQLDAMGVEFVPVRLERAGFNLWRDYLFYRELRRLFKRLKPDVVLAYTAKPVVYGGMAVQSISDCRFYPLITGLGYAFTEGYGIKRRLVRFLATFLYRRALIRSAAVIFQNPDDEALFRELRLILANTPSEVVNGSGVDLAAFPPRDLGVEPIFLMVSRLVADKGVREYVEAAKLVKRRFPDVIFQLAGGLDINPVGISAKELQRWIDAGDIEYLGEVRSVQTLLAASRFFVLPSYREGIPRSILEALSSGRPIITTDAPGCRETVIDGLNGYLVPPRDANALANAMINILKLESEKIDLMAQSSLSLAREKYDVRKVNQRMFEIIKI